MQVKINPLRRSLSGGILPQLTGEQLARRMLQLAAAGLHLRIARSLARLL